MDFGKGLAGRERIAADGADTVRQIDEGQAAAVEEGVVAELGYGIRQRDPDQGIVAFEGLRADGGHIPAPDPRGDVQVAARAGVRGDRDGAVFQKAIMEIPVDKISRLSGGSIRRYIKKRQDQRQQQCRNPFHFL